MISEVFCFTRSVLCIVAGTVSGCLFDSFKYSRILKYSFPVKDLNSNRYTACIKKWFSWYSICYKREGYLLTDT